MPACVPPPSRKQFGLGAIGLIVGLGLGLGLCALALTMLSAQLRTLRDLQGQVLLQRELRMLKRQIEAALQHSGYDNQAHLQTAAPLPQVEVLAGSDSDQLLLRHDLWQPENRLGAQPQLHGFRLRDQELQSLIAGRWQPLSDPDLLSLSELRFRLHSVQHNAPADCPCASGKACVIRLQLQRLQVSLRAQLRRDPGRVEHAELSLPLPNPHTQRLCT